MKYKILLIMLCLGVSIMALTACGKKGALEPVDGGIYPKTYPAE